MRRPEGDTDSEHLFNLLMHDFDDGDPVAGIRAAMRRAVECSPFRGLNILFSDGERLYAYRLGLFELHWLARPGSSLWPRSASPTSRLAQRPAGRPLTLDPKDLGGAARGALLGDECIQRPRSRRSTSLRTCGGNAAGGRGAQAAAAAGGARRRAGRPRREPRATAAALRCS